MNTGQLVLHGESYRWNANTQQWLYCNFNDGSFYYGAYWDTNYYPESKLTASGPLGSFAACGGAGWYMFYGQSYVYQNGAWRGGTPFMISAASDPPAWMWVP